MSDPDVISSLARRASGLLFLEGGAMPLKRLAQQLECTVEDLSLALDILATSMTPTGLVLVRTDTEAAFALSPEAQTSAEKAREKELGRDIGDAGLEVLAVVLYRGPSTRAHIDYIRGVNTSTTIRNLVSRGLLERTGNPSDGREYLYRPTTELLAKLGITKTEGLPDYGTIFRELAAFESRDPSALQGDTSQPHNAG